jgi:hypothetical protein
MRSGPLRRDKGLGRRAQLRANAKALKRGGGLKRNAVMQPGVPNSLVRKAQLRSKSDALARRSPETAQFYAKERVPFVRVMLTRYPICELQTADLPDPPECWNRSMVVHETWTRGRQGGKPKDKYLVPMVATADADANEQRAVWVENRRQFLTLCDRCHDWIHYHPTDAGATQIWREGVTVRLLRRSLEDN